MLRSVESGETLQFHFAGSLDYEACMTMQKEIDEALADVKVPVVFDFKDVDFVSSAFFRICVTTSNKVGRANFSIINVHPLVKKVFKISCLDTHLNVK